MMTLGLVFGIGEGVKVSIFILKKRLYTVLVAEVRRSKRHPTRVVPDFSASTEDTHELPVRAESELSRSKTIHLSSLTLVSVPVFMNCHGSVFAGYIIRAKCPLT